MSEKIHKKKIGIIADSTCDMDPLYLKKYNIRTVPLKVIFGDEIRLQYVDITNKEYYDRLRKGEFPTTGAPAPKAFKEAIDSALQEYEGVLVFCIGNKLSATFSVASMVKKQFFDDRVTIIDTNTLSITMSLIILPAARMINEGATKEEVLAEVNKLIPHTQVFGGAPTLKYLFKGGRLSTAKYYIGTLLKMKPMISVSDGLIVSPGKIRSMDALVEHMKHISDEIAKNRLSEIVIVGHCDNIIQGKIVSDYLQSLPNTPKEVFLWDIGPVIGSHLGPDTLGIVWVGDFKEGWLKK
ncbi:MAG: DegV family protein [Candidatus Heimdallarchaeota archaeon]|nr:DegV family protein [Candidatus Heimdallarchaeota archaeon]